MYIAALFTDHQKDGNLVALCDINQTRMDYANERIQKELGGNPISTYKAHDFDRMIAEEKPDTVIVTSMDRTHHQYICRAMELGCDAITEKPMTIDAEKTQQIVDTIKKTGKDLKVTFNYRYAPRNTKIKEVLSTGQIGEVISVHFEWLLDTKHGADYFRRWHRDKANSGGLMVHKATHHFDLVNWWIGSHPKTVFAFGDLRFYGRQNAERRGVERFYDRAYGSEVAKSDPFALHIDRDEKLRRMYLEAEKEDGYHRDQSVFGYNISTEDTMAVTVKYASKAHMSYSLNAFCPWEGYRVMFNGSEGRLEVNVVERSYVSSSVDDINLPENRAKEEAPDKIVEVPEIIIHKMWDKPRAVEFETAKGGHGGGDVRLLKDIFQGAGSDPLGHAAGYVDGAYSILTGIAANKSMASGLPVQIDDLVKL
jgi:hypothetical protein